MSSEGSGEGLEEDERSRGALLAGVLAAHADLRTPGAASRERRGKRVSPPLRPDPRPQGVGVRRSSVVAGRREEGIGGDLKPALRRICTINGLGEINLVKKSGMHVPV